MSKGTQGVPTTAGVRSLHTLMLRITMFLALTSIAIVGSYVWLNELVEAARVCQKTRASLGGGHLHRDVVGLWCAVTN
jgi:hypothetical protein